MSKVRITRETFCPTYLHMAKEGKSAVEIGNALGVDKLEGKDTPAKVAQFVCQKASNYRKELREQARAKAQEAGLNKKDTEKMVTEAAALLPKLQTRTRQAKDFAAYLTELVAAENPSE